MNRYKQAFDKMVRDGANPRRAAPRSGSAPLIHVIRGTPGWLAYFAGVGSALLVVLAIASFFDLRPARQADIRLASIVRAAVPNPENLATNDLLARLALPRQQSELLVALLGLPAISTSDWLAALTHNPPLRLDPGLLDAIAHLLRRLADQDEQGRHTWLNRLAELDRIARNPEAREVLTIVGNLGPERLHVLAESNSFRHVLEEIADLSERKRDVLLIMGLDVIPDDPARVELLRALPTMDPVAVTLLKRWLNSGLGQHNALRFVLQEIDAKDANFGRLLSGYYLRSPVLMTAIRRLPPLICNFVDPGSCP